MVSTAGVAGPSPGPTGDEQLSIVDAPQGAAVDAARNDDGYVCQQLTPKKDALPKLVDDKVIGNIKQE
jgi:hypothetical protein